MIRLRSSNAFSAASTVFSLMQHSFAIRLRDGKQLSFSLSLCRIRQARTAKSRGLSPSEKISFGSIKKSLRLITGSSLYSRKRRMIVRGFDVWAMRGSDKKFLIPGLLFFLCR